MAEQALQAGEVACLAVVPRGERVPEHVRVAQLGGDLRASAQPREQVLGDVVRRPLAEARVGAIAPAPP